MTNGSEEIVAILLLRSLRLNSSILIPSISISPSPRTSILNILVRTDKILLLPPPVIPIRATFSPGYIFIDTPLSTKDVSLEYLAQTCLNLMPPFEISCFLDLSFSKL